MLVRMKLGGREDTYTLLVGMQIGAATMEISIEASQETQNRTII
jgi:hypothetical protein